LTGPLNLELTEPNLDGPSHLDGHEPIFGKERRGGINPRLGIENLDLLDPRRSLAVVDLAQVKHLALYDPTPGAALILGQAPIAMVLAILEASVALEKQ